VEWSVPKKGGEGEKKEESVSKRKNPLQAKKGKRGTTKLYRLYPIESGPKIKKIPKRASLGNWDTDEG